MKQKRFLLVRNLWRLGMVVFARLVCLAWRDKRLYVEHDRTPAHIPEIVFVGIQSGTKHDRTLHLHLRISGRPWFYDHEGRYLGYE